MSFSVKELCEMVNVSYDRELEANVRVSNEEEDSVESDGGDTAANEDSLESDNDNLTESDSEDSLEHDPENDPDYTPVNEDAVAVDRGRSRKRANPDAWKGNIQKRRRMRGQSYLGRKKNEFINKEERKMEGRCLAESCQKSSKLHCTEIDEGKREEIFKYFWGKLDWKERKIYVKSLAEVSDVKRRRTEAVQSRRSASLCCFLCVDGRRLRVCQRMFLSTLCIKQWSFLKWVGRREESPEKTARVRVRTEERDFLKSFLLDLPKVPSHYCRSSSSKMYLEPLFRKINVTLAVPSKPVTSRLLCGRNTALRRT
ncbi:uncharacterized protein LOC134871130, partial [Eleginops maclovinus]|uniref:uncharacterized protein LOC134871130 n=1 Tax=Eleginops maclovinus TaxID=56733 RepID=UPI0030800A9E